jgi:hypothetical protein
MQNYAPFYNNTEQNNFTLAECLKVEIMEKKETRRILKQNYDFSAGLVWDISYILNFSSTGSVK